MTATPITDDLHGRLMAVPDPVHCYRAMREQCQRFECENANLKRLMRRAIPTIDSRETDYADEFKAACR